MRPCVVYLGLGPTGDVAFIIEKFAFVVSSSMLLGRVNAIANFIPSFPDMFRLAPSSPD